MSNRIAYITSSMIIMEVLHYTVYVRIVRSNVRELDVHIHVMSADDSWSNKYVQYTVYYNVPSSGQY